MNKFLPGWYLLYVRSHQENNVSKSLLKSKNEFLPQENVILKWCDRRKIIQTLFFPKYIFVYIDCSSEFFDCMTIVGVCEFVRSGSVSVKVSQSVIEQIKAIADNGENVVVSIDSFILRQILVIEDEPLKDITCEIIQYHSSNRILLRVDFINRNLVLDLFHYYLKPNYNMYSGQSFNLLAA